MPRKIRHDLTTNLLAQRGEAVQAAFSTVHGNELFRAVEAEIESLAHRATSMASGPTHDDIWTPDNVTDAATSLLRDDPEPSRAALYLAILAQMHTDWETHTPLIKDVLSRCGVADLRAEDFFPWPRTWRSLFARQAVYESVSELPGRTLRSSRRKAIRVSWTHS
jgi:hypothetical protein